MRTPIALGTSVIGANVNGQTVTQGTGVALRLT
jgi:hypothetical protein